MSKATNIHEAKIHVSRLVEQAAAGREIIIAKAGKPIARLVPLAQTPRLKRFGSLKGKIRTPGISMHPSRPTSSSRRAGSCGCCSTPTCSCGR